MFGLFNNKKIFKAIEIYDIKSLKKLLEKEDVNKKFNRPDRKEIGNWCFLLHACLYGNIEIIQILLDKGADLNSKDSDLKTGLYWAACNKNFTKSNDISKYLIKLKIEINAQAVDGRTAINGAILTQNIETLKTLLLSGANPNLTCNLGDDETPQLQSITPLFFSISVMPSESSEFVKILLENKADPNIPNSIGATPLFDAGGQEDALLLAGHLIEHGANINYKMVTPDGMTMYPLDAASDFENKELCEYLFMKKAKYNKDITTIEVEMHSNAKQKSSHDKLKNESSGTFKYEIHFESINSKQMEYIKEAFEEYKWDMGFAVTKSKFEETKNLFKLFFTSKKYFDLDDDNWDDNDYAQNIATRMIGKEQFFCQLYFVDEEIRFDDNNITFIDDKKNKYKVELSKYSSLTPT